MQGTIPARDQGETTRGATLFRIGALAAIATAIWLRPGPALFVGTDAGCYARIARDLAERPFSDAARIMLGGVEFFEHPPLGFWVESLAFRARGASPAAALALARIYATMLAITAFAIGRQLASARVGLFLGLGLIALPGFLYESQNAMLELPLTLACAVGLLSLVELGLQLPGQSNRPVRWGWALVFGLSVAASWFLKGPPALALLGMAVLLPFARVLPGRAAATAMVLGVLVTLGATALFEWVRGRQGLAPFFTTYFQRQVLPSIVSGRHHPDSNLLFYLGPLANWYLPALIALPLGVALCHRGRLEPKLLWTGGLFGLLVVVGFSLPVQKYPWYIHLGMLGAAIVLGATLHALVTPRFDGYLGGVLIAAAILWSAWVLSGGGRPTIMQEQMHAIARRPGPTFAPGAPRAVSNCSQLSSWRAEHLFQFYWGAAGVECTAEAPWKFTGAAVVGVRE